MSMVGALAGDDPKALHRLAHRTGECAARFMTIGMMASGLKHLFWRHSWPRWLVHHGRDLGVAAFLYATLLMVVYTIDRGTLDRLLDARPRIEIWTGPGSRS
jgi:methionine sulfoxide reductase heme-binding subunit